MQKSSKISNKYFTNALRSILSDKNRFIPDRLFQHFKANQCNQQHQQTNIEKSSKIQHACKIKTLSKLGVEGSLLNLIKGF